MPTKYTPKGTPIYRGKYFQVYQRQGRYFVYERDGYTPVGSYKSKLSAKMRAVRLNEQAKGLDWWER